MFVSLRPARIRSSLLTYALDDLRRRVGRGVVADDQLEIGERLIEDRLDRLGEIALPVVDGETDRHEPTALSHEVIHQRQPATTPACGRGRPRRGPCRLSMPRSVASARNVSGRNQRLPSACAKCSMSSAILRSRHGSGRFDVQVGMAEITFVLRDLVLGDEVIAERVPHELSDGAMILVLVHPVVAEHDVRLDAAPQFVEIVLDLVHRPMGSNSRGIGRYRRSLLGIPRNASALARASRSRSPRPRAPPSARRTRAARRAAAASCRRSRSRCRRCARRCTGRTMARCGRSPN